jgi:LysM repeat protein
MLRGKPGIFLVLALLGAVLGLAPGCSKYDGLERNMRYVSDDLLRKDAEVSWQQVTAAHAAWIKSGQSRDPANAEFIAYQDAYGHYAVIYNELWDRQGNPFSGNLHGPTDVLPPPPPGLAVPPAAAKPAAQAEAAAGRDLGETGKATANTPAALVPDAPAQAAPRPAVQTPEQPRQPAPATAAPRQPVQATAQTASQTPARPAGPGSYVIQPGDTLYSIAKRHGLSEKRLAEANGIADPRKIAAGKTLTIPAP